jgi:hypothetical protein
MLVKAPLVAAPLRALQDIVGGHRGTAAAADGPDRQGRYVRPPAEATAAR